LNELPRLVVATIVFISQDDSILLVKQNYGKGYWSLPGGMVEIGESLEEGAIREVREETGLDIRIRKVIGIYSKPSEGAIATSLEGEVIGGKLEPQHEVVECGYFHLSEMPSPIRDHLFQRIDDFREHRLQAVIRTQ
jgi:8-oxo-dGTP diphosphatase